eukprot:11001-Heterococcus_DN1.PRE.2
MSSGCAWSMSTAGGAAVELSSPVSSKGRRCSSSCVEEFVYGKASLYSKRGHTAVNTTRARGGNARDYVY